MAGIFIHAGYPKCGSTFLQDVILDRSPHIFGFDRTKRLARSMTLVPGTLMPQAEQDAGWAALLADFRAQDKPLVVSNESIAMGRWAESGENSREEPFEVLARKVKGYFPEADVVFVLRPQDQWIPSWWSQHVKGLGPVGRMTLARAMRSDYFQEVVRPTLGYAKVVGHYRELYGADRVHVLFMATLAREPERFLREFCAIIGMPVPDTDGVPRNKSVSYGLNVLRSRMNAAYFGLSRRLLGSGSLAAWDERYRRFMKFYFARGDFLARRVFSPRPFSQSQLQEIQDMFRDDNRELADMLGQDLGQYGFHCGGAVR